MIDLISGKLTYEALVEDANHESGHANVATYLGVGPLQQGIELYPAGRTVAGVPQPCYGRAFVCQKDGPGPRKETEMSIQVLIAGQLAQFRLHSAFADRGWKLDLDITVRSFEIRLDAWEEDNRAIHKYLQEIPEHERGCTYSRLYEETKKIVDNQLPAIRQVSQELLQQYSPRGDVMRLSGTRIIEIFNGLNNTQTSVISDCSKLGRLDAQWA
ncbi:MAG: hypothetical protein WCA49_10630 [Candidatus Sulfotelmatobacter sp.]